MFGQYLFTYFSAVPLLLNGRVLTYQKIGYSTEIPLPFSLLIARVIATETSSTENKDIHAYALPAWRISRSSIDSY